MIAIEEDHDCFSRNELAQYQLGKLNLDQMTQIEVEAYSCKECRSLLVSLDSHVDDTLRILNSLGNSAVHSTSQLAKQLPDQPAKYRSRKFGPYKLIRQIGSGGMGEVWEAEDESQPFGFAIKLLPLNRLACEKSRSRFARESTLHCGLVHENLVRAFNAGEVDGIPFLAMELLDGRDTTNWCRKDNLLPITAACELIRQASLGLAHAHARGFVHRDVKPSNIRVTSDGIVKVFDMGLMRALQAGLPSGFTACDTVLGSVAYMAPEQFCNPGAVSCSADVYSLGCMLYHLLTGRSPFADDVKEGVIANAVKRHRQSVPPVGLYRTEVPRRLAKIMENVTSPNPSQRKYDAAQLAIELARFSSAHDLSFAATESSSTGIQLNKKDNSELILTVLAITAVSAAIVFWLVTMVPTQNSFKNLSPVVRLVVQDGDANDVVEEKQKPEGKTVVTAENTSSTTALTLIEDWILAQSMEPAIKKAVLQSIRQHPDEQRWSGAVDGQLFSVVTVESDPSGTARQAIRLAAQRRAHMLAVHDILLTKSLLAAFAERKLDDAVTLKKALTLAELKFIGAPQTSKSKTTSTRGFGRMLESGSKMFKTQVVAFVLANQSDLIAHLAQPPQLEGVRTSYRKVMHAEARRLMGLQRWNGALDLWHHLHSRKLVSPQLYVDAATCFHRRQEDSDALTLLKESFTDYRSSGSLDFFESIGNLALAIGGAEAEKLAVSAYNRARELL